jgi:hypothetical protein
MLPAAKLAAFIESYGAPWLFHSMALRAVRKGHQSMEPQVEWGGYYGSTALLKPTTACVTTGCFPDAELDLIW